MSQQWHQRKALGGSVKRTGVCEYCCELIAHNYKYPSTPHILHPLSLPTSSIQYVHPSSPFPPHPLSTAAWPPSVGSPWPSVSSPHTPAPSSSSCSSPAPPTCSSPLSICWTNLFGRRGGKDGGQGDSAKSNSAVNYQAIYENNRST